MPRVYRFIKTNVLFALLPLVIVFGLRTLANAPAPLSAYAPEILFLSIMVSVAAIDDINEETRQFRPLLFDAIRSGLQILIFLSIGLYCAHTYSDIRNPADVEFRNNVTVVAAILSPVLCCIGIAAEILLVVIKPKGATP